MRYLSSIQVMVTWIALALLAGCATTSDRGSKTPSYLAGEDVDRTVSAAATCEQPLVSKRIPKSTFKYGCFCGAGHPGLKHPSGKPEADLSDDERRELALSYMSRRPVDDIDGACQAHDVCWLLKGNGAANCNRDFIDRLDYLHGVFKKGDRALSPSETTPRACASMALDIQIATLHMMDDSSAGVMAARVVALPIALFDYLAIHGLRKGGWGYPAEPGKCLAANFEPASPKPLAGAGASAKP